MMAATLLLGGPASQLSGTEIIDDLAACLVEALSKGSELRSSDAYRSYSAKITISLQLNSLDTVSLDQAAVVGDFDASRPATLEIEIVSPLAGAEEVRERMDTVPPSVERCIVGPDDVRPEPPPETQRRRWYAPRKAGHPATRPEQKAR